MGSLYRHCLRPLLFLQDSEAVHNRVLRGLSVSARLPALPMLADALYGAPDLPVTFGGLKFPNPVGLAAGMDKAAAAVPMWERLGFGFAELGGVTRHAQTGNDTPRMFRAVADRVAVQVEQVDPLATLREQIHVLDLHAKGVMDAHVDSEWAFGGCLASVALLSDCVVRLRNRECPGAEVVDILVPRRSLYILSSDARYGWTHEITDTSGGEAAAARVPSILLAETEEEEDAADFASVPVGQLPAVRQQFGEQQVERTRRVSFLFRSQASSAAAAVGERER